MAKRAAINGIVAALVLAPAIVWMTQTHGGAYDPDEIGTSDVSISAAPVKTFNKLDPAQTVFGRLAFRGGLVLTANQRHFGGWSGLALDPDGKNFIAVSDRGAWMTATLEYADGAPSGVGNARLGPLLAEDGQRYRRSHDRDAESIAIVDGTAHQGTVIVGFEQHTRIVRYGVSEAGMSKGLGVLELPRGSADMRSNNGFEAMTVMRGGPFKGSPIAISERLYNASRNHTGWIWTTGGIKPFHLTNIGDFDVTDLASLDDGTLFVLERRFRWIEGVKMRIRRIDAGDLQPGKTIVGETLIEADMNYEIDNMEGLAATRAADGGVLLTVLSDDNFNLSLQRTLLLQFAVTGVTAEKTRP